jgi:hypothetical protein
LGSKSSTHEPLGGCFKLKPYHTPNTILL